MDEYPEDFLGEFKHDYYHYGKFNLDAQVFHLSRLAEFYHKKFKVTRNWTDCVKAHALYNSVGARKPESIDWKERVFEIQQLYWGGKSALSFDQQQKLTASLKHELESIREQSRDEMPLADGFVEAVDNGQQISADHWSLFYSCMQKISTNCSERMSKFAGRIISESVTMISPQKPPCEFVAVAIGSLARGEVTPYSDLEYLFLVAEDTDVMVEYFERLAITNYFQITNLGETKLSYMAIKELKGWYDDCSKNGFKIDGLSEKAGNIPTGNGTPKQLNHFIVTPQKLAIKYKTVLDNPDETEAMRGDLTAMLTYMKPIYSHKTSERDLLVELQVQMLESKANEKRMSAHRQMIDNDLEKFCSHPQMSLLNNNFGADVKKEFYRYPSILCLDIAVYCQVITTTSWEFLKSLPSKELSDMFKILLAAASYMRLSAYLFHDSQDDRISVAPTSKPFSQQSRAKTHQRRWFVPSGLYVFISLHTSICQHRLSYLFDNSGQNRKKANFVVVWSHITGLYNSGRHQEAFGRLKEMFGESLYNNPLSIIQKLPPYVKTSQIIRVVSDTLRHCKEYRPALVLYNYMSVQNISDTWEEIAMCYFHIGELETALYLVQNAKEKDPARVQHLLMNIYFKMGNYDISEVTTIDLLNSEHLRLMAPEQQYDHSGNQADINEPQREQYSSNERRYIPTEQLSRIMNNSPIIISCVYLLASIHLEKGMYSIAAAHFTKAKELISELYGEGAAVCIAADAMSNLGRTYNESGQCPLAIEELKQALSVYRQLSTSGVSGETAATLRHIGNNCQVTEQYQQAETYYKQSLAEQRKLPKCIKEVAVTLHDLGYNYNAMHKFTLSRDYLEQALEMFRESLNGKNCFDTAMVCQSLGEMFYSMELYQNAEGYFRESLFILRDASKGDVTEDIAKTLKFIGDVCSDMGRVSEAADYIVQAQAVSQISSVGVNGIKKTRT